VGAALLAITSVSDAAAMSYGLISLPDGSNAIVAQGRIEGNETGRLLSIMRSIPPGNLCSPGERAALLACSC
jgi:hypothetical protein